ncbi:hypothetical protein SISSUDRAFT_1053376 [Sistotremastrum suecicum HHB10207 ss-3]|uniref:MYND-type domain-containing protein n=1 Tax=Sistotremastrum suecicum HHB10207 ss-3 TaxID=1314776 RepID=A0A165Z9F2_9AGAM|nr:hypothetical protein SISSUDRAFT_1053376 [Sistotremastrum suecicum HHB10207 ss-3]
MRKPAPRKSVKQAVKPVANACLRSEKWTEARRILKEYLHIDTGSHDGLKKINDQYSQIMPPLRKLYRENRRNYVVIAGVIGVLGEMCVDANLRDKIYEDEWLPRMVSLLEHKEGRDSALEALARLTAQRVAAISQDLALNHFEKLYSALLDSPVDSDQALKVIRIMGDVLMSAIDAMDPSTFAKSLTQTRVDPRRFLDFLMDRMQGTTLVASTASNEEIMLVSALAQLYADVVLSTPRHLQFFVACLRSSSLIVRSYGLRVLRAICCQEDGTYGLDDPQRIHDIRIRGAIQQSMGAETEYDHRLRTLLGKRGKQYYDPRTLLSVWDIVKERTLDLDLFQFGIDISQAILETKQATFPFPFRRKSHLYPFETWTDVLPHSASLLRSSSEFDKADIIDIAYLTSLGKLKDAARLARIAAKRSPNVGFWYDVISESSSDPSESLRTCQKGLQCPNLSAMIRYNLLLRSSVHSWTLALNKLNHGRPDDVSWNQGFTYLAICHESLRSALSIGPLDAPGLIVVAELSILVNILIHGPDLSSDLSEIEPILEKARVLTDLNDCLWEEESISSSEDDCTMVKDIVLEHLQPASIKWKGFIQSTDHCVWAERERIAHHKTPCAEEEISGLVQSFQLPARPSFSQKTMSKLFSNIPHDIPLQSCSWCRNPGAALLKSAACEEELYFCDQICEKLHRNEHTRHDEPLESLAALA